MKRMMSRAAAATLALTLAFFGRGALAKAAEEDVVLTKDAPRQVAIVLPESAGEPCKKFAALLQRRLQQAMDGNVPIVGEDQAGALDLAFQVGPTRVSLGEVPEQAQLPPHGYIVRYDGKGNVILAAKDEFAVGFAVVEFADKVMNCRQYMPAPLGECIAKTDRLVIPRNLNIVRKPALQSVFMSGLTVPGERYDTKYKQMEVAYQLYLSDNFHHNFHRILPPEKYGKDHPEYYPELDGVRRVPGSGKGTSDLNGGWQPCFSNPEVFRITLDYCLNFFKENPGATTVSIAVNDAGGYCMCAACQAQGKQFGEPWIPNLYYDFANRIAREVQKQAPGKKVGFLRGTTRMTEPPSFPIEKNVLIYDVHPGKAGLTPWVEKGASMGVYTWLYGEDYVTPRFFPHEFQRQLKNWLNQGAVGFYAEAYPNWIVDAPMLYIAAHVARDLDADVNALLAQYARDMFGAAAPEIVKFYTVAERAMDRRGGQEHDSFERLSSTAPTARYQFECWRVEDVQEMDEALAAGAKKLDANSAEGKRMKLLQTWWAWSREFILSYALARQVAAAAPSTTAEVEAMIPAILEVTRHVAAVARQWDKDLRDIDKGTALQEVGIYMRQNPSPVAWMNGVNLWLDPTVWPSASIDSALTSAGVALLKSMRPEEGVAFWDALAARYPDAASYLKPQATLARGDLRNLISNSSFEELDPFEKKPATPEGCKIWMDRRGYQEDVGVVDERSHTGKRSFRLGTGEFASLDRTITVQPGARYLVRVWVYQNSKTSDAQVSCLIYDKSGKMEKAIRNRTEPGQMPVGKWCPIEAIVSIPDYCDKLSIDLATSHHAQGEATWFDDLFVARLY